MNKTIEKIQDRGVTHKEVVFNFFMPISKLSGNSVTKRNFVKNGMKRIIKTEYGKLEIRNKILTEFHHNLIRTILQKGETRLTADKKIMVLFEEKVILRELSMGEKNHSALREQIKTIADAQYYLTVGTNTKKISIITSHAISDADIKRQAIVFDDEFIKMNQSVLSVSGDSVFDKVAKIPYSTIPSIIRCIIFNHKVTSVTTYHLHSILNDIGFPTESPSSVKEIRKTLKLYSQQLKSDYNIEYDPAEKTFKYSGLKKLNFSLPLQDSISEVRSYIGKILKYENQNYKIRDIVIDDNYTNWVIVTEVKKIEIRCFMDDFIYLLEKTTFEETRDELLIS